MENKKIKILAIDDNKDNLITLNALVKESFPDAKIFSSTTGAEGLTIAVAEDPDVILLDIVMPDMDGFEVCKKLKANLILKDIPVVFITAIKGDKDSRIKALEVGAEAFLAKPIDETELLAQIRAMCKIKKANIEKRDEKLILSKLVEEQTKELTETHIATLNLMEDLKKENDARKKSEEKFSSIFKNMGSGCCYDEIVYKDGVAVDYIIVDVNPMYEKILHISRKDVVGKLASEVYKTENIPFFDIYVRVAETGIAETYESFFEPAGIFLQITTTCPEKGKFSNIFSDVTERKKAEVELKKKTSELEQMNEYFIGREVRMIDLKKEINDLLLSIGEKEKYVVHTL